MASLSSWFARLVHVLQRSLGRSGMSLLLTAGVLALVIHALHQALSEVDYAQLVQLMRQTSGQALVYSCLATAASYLALTGYDFSALRYLRLRQPPPRSAVAVTSFMAYTLGNTVGLGVLAGGAVRMRMLVPFGLTPLQVTRVIAFNALAFGAGITVYGALGLWVGAATAAQYTGLPQQGFQALALLVFLGAAALLWCCARVRQMRLWRWRLELPTLALALRQLGITGLDTLFAALALWCLLPADTVPWWTFFSVFLLALAAGVVSHVPGGLGVFEVIMLAGLGGTLPASSLAAALVLYRVVYYLLPLLAAALLMAAYALWMRLAQRHGGAALRLHATSAAIAGGLAWVAPLVLGALCFAAGIVLLISGATPASHGRAGLLALHVPWFLIEASHLVGSVCGLLMLVLARGLVHRLDAAWWLALLVSAIAIWLALPMGIAWHELAVLGPLLGLLLISREQFDRRSSLVGMRLEGGWLVAIAATLAAVGWLLYFAYRHEVYSDEQWWLFAVDAHAPRSLRAAMLVAVAALLWGSWQLLRRHADARQLRATPPTAAGSGPADAADAADAAGRLATLTWERAADLQWLRSSKGHTRLAYRRRGRTWIAPQAPDGPQSDWPELIEAFLAAAALHGMRPALLLPHGAPPHAYLEAGLRLVPLGELAWLNLLEGMPRQPRRTPLRLQALRARRQGWHFALMHGQALQRLLPRLQALANEWQAEQPGPQRGLAAAPLEEALRAGPVAVVCWQGQPAAFASLALLPNRAAVIERMRCRSGTPPQALAYLWLRLLGCAQRAGVAKLCLGLWPQAEESDPELATNWHRTARLLLRQGECFSHSQTCPWLLEGWSIERQPLQLATRGPLAGLLAVADLAGVASRKAGTPAASRA